MLRPYTHTDHPTLSAWWIGHAFPVVPARIIPPFSFFSCSPDQGTPLAFACAYLDNGGTGVAMLEWIVTNPEIPARKSLRALDELLPFMRDHIVTELGYSAILATCRQPALSRLLDKHQFQRTDSAMFHHLYSTK